MRRPVDQDRLRQLARAARAPRGRGQAELVPARYVFLAEVTATQTTPNRVTLDRHGTAITGARYLAHYSPTVTDTVLCEYVGDELVVWGKFA